MKNNKYTLVGMTLKTAQWLGMAPSVLGGCVAVTEAGRDAASAVGYDCVGLIPSAWLPDASYSLLTEAQIATIAALLLQSVSGWSGAARINADRAETAKMLAL